jgi:hypothetical protein
MRFRQIAVLAAGLLTVPLQAQTVAAGVTLFAAAT